MISITGSASGSRGVAGVQFQLDGVNLGAEVTAPPYSFSWNTTTTTSAAHNLTAVARYTDGNILTSSTVAVAVSNNPPGEMRFEDTDASVSYTAGWTRDSTSRPWSGGTAALSRTAGAQATFTFTGTAESWISLRGPQTGIARLSVDGIFVAEIDTFSPFEQVSAMVFRTTALAATTPSLMIEVTGRKNSASAGTYIIVDAFTEVV